MLSRCPYSDCQHEMEVIDDLLFRKGHCSACARAITFRSLDMLSQISRIEQGYKRALSKTIADKESTSKHLLLTVAEDIRSLFNVGSIFRTADGAGFSRLYLCGITGFPPNKQIEKTSLGAEQHIDWEYYSSTLEIIPELKNEGIQIIGLEKNGSSQSLSVLLSAREIRTPLCLIVGNEVTGLSAETLDNCDIVAHLPMYGKKESLNVAVAYGIASYMLVGKLKHDITNSRIKLD